MTDLLLTGGSHWASLNGIKEERKLLYKRFNLEVAYVVSYCASYFKHLKIPGSTGIRIDTTDDELSPDRIEDPIPKVYSNFRVIFYCDYPNEYFNNDDAGKIRVVVEMLKKAIYRICEHINLDKTGFVEAFERIKERNGVFVFGINKPKANKSKTNAAGLIVRIFPEKRECYLQILAYPSLEPLEEIFIVSENNYSPLITWEKNGFRYIKTGKWETNDLYVTMDERKRILHQVNVANKSSQVCFIGDETEKKYDTKDYYDATSLDQEKWQQLIM